MALICLSPSKVDEVREYLYIIVSLFVKKKSAQPACTVLMFLQHNLDKRYAAWLSVKYMVFPALLEMSIVSFTTSTLVVFLDEM